MTNLGIFGAWIGVLSLCVVDVVPNHPFFCHHTNMNTEGGSSSESLFYGIEAVSKRFQEVLQAIAQRVRVLSDQTERSVNYTKAQVDGEIEDVDKEINRLKNIMKTCDELEVEFTKIRQIGEISEDFKRRLKNIESELR